MFSPDHMVVVVPRQDIESGDLRPALEALNSCFVSPDAARGALGAVELVIEGYEHIPTELFEMEPVRHYIRRLDNEFPYWLYFLGLRGASLRLIFGCFLPPFLGEEERRQQFAHRLRTVMENRWLPAMNDVASFAGLSAAELADRTDAVVAYFQSGAPAKGFVSTVESPTEPVVEEVFYGQPTGVEIEQNEDRFDQRPLAPWDPEQIRISTRTFSLRNVLDMIDDSDLELAPDFQRNRVWKGRQKSRLIESLLLQIPLPAFYFAEDRGGMFRVVDGLQRLSTVHEFVQGRLALDELEYLAAEHGKTFADLEIPLRRRLQNAQIVVHVIEPSTPNRVKYDIFKRINTGGEPLNAMEIRHCMSSARSRDLLKRCAASAVFHEATAGVLRDHIRMNDREAVLRFLAFYRLPDLQEYDSYGSLENLLDATTELLDDPRQVPDAQLESWFAAFERGMLNARTIFGDYTFRRWPTGSDRRSPINRALLESWGVVLAAYRPDQLEPARARIVAEARAAMAKNNEYIAAISASTADPKRVRIRFEVPRRILEAAVVVSRPGTGSAVHGAPADNWCVVPADDAGEQAFIEFAHTYNGFDGYGGPEQLGELVRGVREAHGRTRALPDNLPLLRSCLFYEVRAHRHGGDAVPFDSNEFVRALISRIREVSRGSVPVIRPPE
ncbi:DUF262 domain-containing protein [Nocardia tengchongensis]|uniref:DUF262 domain-containing protein n=1 Tax=Nocardia tengchongensis TaxID=2055889 RepID=UPI003689DC08